PLVCSYRLRKIDLRPRNLRDFLVQGEFRAIISGQSFKLAESIGFNVSESGNHGFLHVYWAASE
ncbi:hypothetical protein, partial [Candidatus Erwinia dacicola]|uniref:hypothetical protein n=1 Tax=Candidatus Erwinia dacicola TaxID=252393 RepID=UPI001C9A03E2